MEVHVPLKCWLTSNRLQGIICQIIERFSLKYTSYITHISKSRHSQCNAQWIQLSPLTDISIVGCIQFSQTKAGPCLQWIALKGVHASFRCIWYLNIAYLYTAYNIAFSNHHQTDAIYQISLDAWKFAVNTLHTSIFH